MTIPEPPEGYGDLGPGFDGMSSIPAPPGHWVGPPLAEWPQRAIGALVDGAIVAVPYFVLLKMGSFGLAFLASGGLFFYFAYLQGTSGQTPGKKVAQVKLLREADGRPLGFGPAVLRGVLHAVDALPCGVGFLWPLWDPKKQTFADKISASVVIRA